MRHVATQAALGLLVWLVGCESAGLPEHSLAGTWIAGQHQVSPSVIRANATQSAVDPIVATLLSIREAETGLRWCRMFLRDDEVDPRRVDPCDCVNSRSPDCAAGTLRLIDGLAPSATMEVALSHDDARADLIGTLAWYPGSQPDRLALNVVRVDDEPTRRPDATTGMQGPLWSGADGLTWFERTDPADAE